MVENKATEGDKERLEKQVAIFNGMIRKASIFQYFYNQQIWLL